MQIININKYAKYSKSFVCCESTALTAVPEEVRKMVTNVQAEQTGLQLLTEDPSSNLHLLNVIMFETIDRGLR